MSHLLLNWLGREGFLPHGYCFTWSPGLLWSMVVSDGVIAASYYSIPVALVHFARRRPDVQYGWLLWLFSAFIFACGTTHLLSIWTVWIPDYALQSVAKVLTAGVSLVTAVALWPLMPHALRIPSVAQLQDTIRSLDAEIGRRKTVEEHLAETEQVLSLTLASIGAGFIVCDRTGAVVRMNAVAERVTGWAQAEAHGRVLWQVLVRDDRPADMTNRNPIDVVVDAGFDADTVHRVKCTARDGSRAALELRAALTRGPDGSIVSLVIVFRDMTQLVQVQAEAERLAAIVESSQDAIVGCTLDGHITSMNAAAQAMYGYSHEEAIGQPVDMLMPVEHRANELRMLAAVAAGDRIPAFDTTRRGRDGQLIDVSMTVSPIRDAARSIIGISKVARDISEFKRTALALSSSEEQLRFTLEAAGIADWELDLASGAMKASASLGRCFGYGEQQRDWTLDTLIDHLHPDDRTAAWDSQRAAVRQGSEWFFDCRAVWPDGSTHWVHLIGRIPPRHDPAARMLGILMDTTEKKQAEDARVKAHALAAENQQVLEANRLKGEFLANMSHELRTPLNAIIGFADLLHAGKVPQGSPKHKVFIDHIRTSGRHLLQLINDILDLSKVEAGKFEFFAEPVELAVLTGEVVDTLAVQASAKAIAVGIEIGPEVEHVVIDPQRLRQVLFNYLSNALKFTPSGGTVTVRAKPEPGDDRLWRLEVEDTGIGIPPEQIGRLFTSFQQLAGGLAKTHAGTGLGLALTKRLAEAQGGSVGVRSVPGQGAVFHALLPRHARIDPALTLDASAPVAGPGAQPCAPARAVLVVEDNPADAQVLADALRGAGFEVAVAGSAAEALGLCAQRSFAAITLDLLLPDRPGLELLGDIRAGGLNREVPVVLVTVMAASLPTPAAAYSVTDVLAKPIHAPSVIDALRRAGVAAREDIVILVVDDDRQSRELMTSVLTGAGYAVSAHAGGHSALALLETVRAGAVILDLSMPGLDGFDLLDRLRDMPSCAGLPVFVWTSRDMGSQDYRRLHDKVDAVFQKSRIDIAVVLAHIRARLAPA